MHFALHASCYACGGSWLKIRHTGVNYARLDCVEGICFAADTRGAFVQPALYEAFGLTVVEAMSCGLPTFATICGGPAEARGHLILPCLS